MIHGPPRFRVALVYLQDGFPETYVYVKEDLFVKILMSQDLSRVKAKEIVSAVRANLHDIAVHKL